MGAFNCKILGSGPSEGYCPRFFAGEETTETKQALLAEEEEIHRTYRDNREPRNVRFKTEGSSEDSGLDEETDTEVEPKLLEKAEEFFAQLTSDKQLVEICRDQYYKLLKLRKYRKMMIYLEATENPASHNLVVQYRIEVMLSRIKSVYREDQKDFILEAMVKITLRPQIKEMVILAINSNLDDE